MNDVAMQRLNNHHSEQKCNSNEMELGNNKIEFGKYDVLKIYRIKERCHILHFKDTKGEDVKCQHH